MSDKFYEDYPTNLYPEIEQKSDRPYIYVAMQIGGIQFAVPLRSDIKHAHVLWTDKKNKCGVDFSKAVVIVTPSYINTSKRPYIRPNEFRTLLGKEYIIYTKMVSYIKKYKNAKSNFNIEANRRLCLYSTLQYFEKYI